MKQFIELQQKFQDRIDSIIDNYDFEKVERTMKALNWKWATLNVTLETPEIYELKKTARKLLNDVVDSYVRNKMKYEYYFISTGGFKAYIAYGNLGLSFEVESWEEEISNEEEE